MSEPIELPYVYDYPKLADYMKAVKPVRPEWDYLHRGSEWKSPVDEWKWCWDQPEAEQC